MQDATFIVVHEKLVKGPVAVPGRCNGRIGPSRENVPTRPGLLDGTCSTRWVSQIAIRFAGYSGWVAYMRSNRNNLAKITRRKLMDHQDVLVTAASIIAGFGIGSYSFSTGAGIEYRREERG